MFSNKILFRLLKHTFKKVFDVKAKISYKFNEKNLFYLTEYLDNIKIQNGKNDREGKTEKKDIFDKLM